MWDNRQRLPLWLGTHLINPPGLNKLVWDVFYHNRPVVSHIITSTFHPTITEFDLQHFPQLLRLWVIGGMNLEVPRPNY